MSTITDLSLLRLMQLSSASLPVGGYSFSQGLEYAVDSGWINNQQQTAEWVSLTMFESIAKVDLPLLFRLMDALKESSATDFYQWNATVLACRETDELLLTETAMGDALLRLLKNLTITFPEKPETIANQQISFIAMFAVAANHWAIEKNKAAVGYLWSWLENQVAAATKLVPLGQTSAQQLLVELGESIATLVTIAEQCKDDDIGSSLPGLAMASSWHETQYSRLFRS
ncbi:MAG: urease accessory protein UreF [Cellvibrionaceae bacterium]